MYFKKLICLLLVLTQGGGERLKGNRVAPGKARSYPDCAAHCIRKFQSFPPNKQSHGRNICYPTRVLGYISQKGEPQMGGGEGGRPKIIFFASQRVREFQVCFRRGWGGSLDNKCI